MNYVVKEVRLKSLEGEMTGKVCRNSWAGDLGMITKMVMCVYCQLVE